ncbi:MAG: hypothetical protein AABY01_02185 [Nanoarchaeota archaeon]
MGRPALINPTVSIHMQIRSDLMTKVDLLLYSNVEGKVPYGAYQRFFTERLNEYFDNLAKGAKQNDTRD